jgi:metalloendopeptidase OMA1, mitochondrial
MRVNSRRISCLNAPILQRFNTPLAQTTPCRILRRLWLLLLIPLSPLLFSSCATVDAVTGQNVYNMYTVDDDIQLGQEAMKANLDELEKKGVRIDADPARVAQLQEIMRRITSVSDMPQLPYQVTLIHTNIVNACAMPGGQMIVFQGLYDGKDALVKDEDEMAAVMAHEIAHVNCRHTTEEMSKIMTAAAIAEIVAVVAERNDEDKLATAIRGVFTVGSMLWIPMHSRGDEAEADRVSMFYMAKAGYDPRAAPRIWQRVYEKEKKEPGILNQALSLFATHPSDENRYKDMSNYVPYAMEEYVKAVGSYPKGYDPAEHPAAVGGEFNRRTTPAK